jgi:hypothetical protein
MLDGARPLDPNVSFIGDLYGDPVLLRVLRHTPFRLQIADQLLEGLAVCRAGQGCRALFRRRPHEVFR